LGAGLYALAGGRAVAIMDAATFLISAALLSRLRSRDLVPPRDRAGFLPELIEGLKTVWNIPVVRRLIVITAGVMAAAGMTEVGVFSLIADGLHKPPAFLGVLAGVQGITAVATGLSAGYVVRRLGELRVAAIAALAFAAAFGLVGLFPSVPVAFLAAGLGGIGNTAYFVAMTTLIQRSVASELQGRVMSTAEAVVNLPYILSIALGAAIVDAVGFTPIFEVSAAILAAGGLALALGRIPAPAVLGIGEPVPVPVSDAPERS
jgi:predicted MFS family arabinose efflux permease